MSQLFGLSEIQSAYFDSLVENINFDTIEALRIKLVEAYSVNTLYRYWEKSVFEGNACSKRALQDFRNYSFNLSQSPLELLPLELEFSVAKIKYFADRCSDRLTIISGSIDLEVETMMMHNRILELAKAS